MSSVVGGAKSGIVNALERRVAYLSSRWVVVEHSDSHSLNDIPLEIHFDEEPEAIQEESLDPQPGIEDSFYPDDTVRMYLREMGTVPLPLREGEVDLARRMERGKLRIQKQSAARHALN